jgi:hypothetical protein
MPRYYVLPVFVALVNIPTKLLCTLMYDETAHLLLGTVETEVAFAVCDLEDLVFDGVGDI